MRFLRDPRAIDRDEQWGLVSPRPLAPTIRRSRKRFRLPPPTFHRVNTLGYVCWLAFLVFWIVFGRATLFFYMTTAGFAPTNGLELDLFPTALTRTQIATLQQGGEVVSLDGTYRIDPARFRVLHLEPGRDGTLPDVNSWWASLEPSPRSTLDAGRYLVVFVSMPGTATYQDAVTVMDALRALDDPERRMAIFLAAR